MQHLSDAGQAVLVTAHRAALARGGQVHLHQPSPQVVAALRASGLRHLLQGPARLAGEAWSALDVLWAVQ